MKTIKKLSATAMVSLMLAAAPISNAIASPATNQMHVYLSLLDYNVGSNDENTVRNGAIAFLTHHTRETVQHYQALTNENLWDILLGYVFLRNVGASTGQISNWSNDDMRNTVIAYVHHSRGIAVPTLQSDLSPALQYKFQGVIGQWWHGYPAAITQLNMFASNWRADPNFNLQNPTTGQCNTYDTALSKVQSLPASISSARRERDQKVGVINKLLAAGAKVPGFSTIFGGIAKINPALKAAMDARDRLNNRVAQLESELLNNQNLVNNPNISGTCNSCRDKHKRLVGDRNIAKNYGTFFDYVNYLTSLNVQNDNKVGGVPAVKGYDPVHSDVYDNLTQPNTPMFQYFRYTYEQRNAGVPFCQ